MRVLLAIAPLAIFAALVIAPFFLFFRILRSPILWGPAIRAFEREPPQPGVVVFIGSSSVRFWTTLASDIAPLPALNRGFGGATVVAVNHYARRILAGTPEPRAIVLYAGGNDLAWGFSVDRVYAEVERFIGIATDMAPRAPIYVMSVQLAPSRAKDWRNVWDLNARIQALAARSAGRVRYIDVVSTILDPQGRPRRELFVYDGIHMNPAGYALWTAVVRPRLMQDLAAA